MCDGTFVDNLGSNGKKKSGLPMSCGVLRPRLMTTWKRVKEIVCETHRVEAFKPSLFLVSPHTSPGLEKIRGVIHVGISELYCLHSSVNLDRKDEYWNFRDQSVVEVPNYHENPMSSLIDSSSWNRRSFKFCDILLDRRSILLVN